MTKITIEGRLVSAQKSPEVGSYYKHTNGNVYILVEIKNRYGLINLETGGEWGIHAIALTKKAAFGEKPTNFTLLNNVKFVIES